jgi:peptidyl-prolyl cis-trans isomerase D
MARYSFDCFVVIDSAPSFRLSVNPFVTPEATIMLEQMRKSSQSLLIYVLFGIVIAVFIINFGPQSRGGSGCDGATGGDESAASVAGNTVPSSAFRYAFMLMGGANQPTQMLKLRRFKETVMDRLLERELLAEEAQRLGIAVSEDDVHKLLLDGRIVGLGLPHTVSRIQKDGLFNYDLFKNFSQYELGLTPDAFVAQQQRELLATRMRDFLRSTVSVSPEEVKTEFESKSRQINLEYVRFPSRKFEGQVEATPEEIALYVKANEGKLKEAFEQRKGMYTDIPGELRVHEIVVKAAPSAAGEAEPAEADQAVARKRAVALMTRLTQKASRTDSKKESKSETAKSETAKSETAKTESFVTLARQASEDPDSQAKGGDLGWRRKGSLGLEPADETKLFAARSGDVVGPFKTSRGYLILLAGPERHGTLSYAQVKDELAEERVKQDKAVQLAKTKANAALALAKSATGAGKTLKELFPPEAVKASESKADSASKSPAHPATINPGDVRAEETGLFGRRGSIVEQIGDSPELAKAAFELKTDAPLAGPFEIAGSYVVVRLKERKDPDMAEFEKKKVELRTEAELIKWNDVFTNWVQTLCKEEKAAGRLTVNRNILRYEDSKEPPPYEPCSREPAFPRRPS